MLRAKSAFCVAASFMSTLGEECPGGRLRVVLVRHGESMNNIHEAKGWEAYVKGRSADPDLSPRGYAQAQLLGSWLGSAKAAPLGLDKLTELWVSPHRRTLLTMSPLAAATGLAPRVTSDIFEAGGIYDANDDYTVFTARGGLTRDEMSAEFPSYVLPDDVTDSGWYRGPGKETDDECRERAKLVAERLRDKAKRLEADEQLVLVVHYDFINALLDALLLPATTGPFDRWKLWNTGITVFDLDARAPDPALLAINAIPHILQADDPHLVSGFNL